MKKELLVIFGTRPEVIKLAPVVRALAGDGSIAVRMISTGQHQEVLVSLFVHFGLEGVITLPVVRGGGGLPELISEIAGTLGRELARAPVDGIVVQGDTTSAMVAAICGFCSRVPVFHVEAGLRTGDLNEPFPEEFNRRVITLAAALHFAPTAGARENLLNEGVAAGKIRVTGNPCIDALFWTLKGGGQSESAFPAGTFGILATCHRRENWEGGIEEVSWALRELVRRIPESHVVFPIHPNPKVRKMVEAVLSGQRQISLVPAMEYGPFCRAMRDARLIISDSGGIQEEALALGKPTLVARWKTERPEVLDGRTVRLAGPQREKIIAEAMELHGNPEAYAAACIPAFPFGRGDSAEQIGRELRAYLCR